MFGAMQIPLLGPTADPLLEQAQRSKDLLDDMINSAPQGRCNSVDTYKKIGNIEDRRGGSSTVFKAKRNETDEEVIIKKLPIDKSGKNGLSLACVREVTASKMLKHDNIVRLVEVVVGKKMESIFLALEYCEEDLGKILDEIELPLAQDEIKNLIGQLLTGLEYIHEMGFIHRDINPSNLLLSNSGVLKICDFGLARMGANSGSMTPNVGTDWYKAPEMIFELESYTTAVDMWSAGCVLGEMFKNAPLFKSENQMTILSKIIDLIGTPDDSLMPGYSNTAIAKSYDLRKQPYNMIGSQFKDLPAGAKLMLKSTICYNPRRRFTAKQALSSEYFSEEPAPLDTAHLVIGITAKKSE